MAHFFKVNTGRSATTCLERLQCFFQCLNKEELHTKRKWITPTYKKFFDKETRLISTRTILKITCKEVKIEGRHECFTYMLHIARSFCSYIKHDERAKLQRRAIASPNMIMRMFLHIIEDFHLRLSKTMTGSTIAIGGGKEEENCHCHAKCNNCSLSKDIRIAGYSGC